MEVVQKPIINHGGRRTGKEEPAAEPEDEEKEMREEEERKGENKDLTESTKEDKEDKGVHIFWRNGTARNFNVHITYLNAESSRGALPDKIWEKNEREINKKYQEKYWAKSRDFTPLVYTVDGMEGRDARAQKDW